MKGRGTIVLCGEWSGGSRVGTVELAGAWVHFLPDAKPHEDQGQVQAVTYSHRDVATIYWDLEGGPFAVARPDLRSAA